MIVFEGKTFLAKSLDREDSLTLYKWLDKGLFFYNPAFLYCSCISDVGVVIEELLNGGGVNCLILSKPSQEPIGVISISNLDRKNLRAEISFFFVRLNKSSLEALCTAFDHLFRKEALNKVFFHVLGRNKRVLRMAEKLGLNKEGVFVKEIKLGDSWEDVVRFSLFRKEYEENPVFSKIRRFVGLQDTSC